MIVTVTLTTPGSDTGPFDIYSNVDGYATPIATNISRASLISGYTLTNVPATAVSLKVVSIGICATYIILNIVGSGNTTTTTTSSTSTSTSTSSTTTTSTTLVPPTTTTTTTYACMTYRVTNNDSVDRSVYWYNCGSNILQVDTVFANSNYLTPCAKTGSVGTDASSYLIDPTGRC